ncbi:hypothetical protein [Tabrizicola caldifontis]|uniref:hypothetical protein n=1 Tax=Tabrizicola caldifontis TaxID=2528036 RepID=UPI001081E3B9|nr:hypothetical protein [Rhodobacter sp. YIM 73028]
MPFVLAVLAVFLTIFIVPVLVHGAISRLTGLRPPGDDPLAFLAGAAVSKIGTAVAFVGIWVLAQDSLAGALIHYVSFWWVMFVLGEIGQAIGPDYSWPEALGGILSETIYLPLSGVILLWLLPV